MGFWIWLGKKFIKLVICPEIRFMYPVIIGAMITFPLVFVFEFESYLVVLPLIIGGIITMLLPVYEFYLEELRDV